MAYCEIFGGIRVRIRRKKGEEAILLSYVCCQLWLSQGRPYLGPRVGKGVNHPLPSECKVGVLRGKPELILFLNIVIVFCVYLDVETVERCLWTLHGAGCGR